MNWPIAPLHTVSWACCTQCVAAVDYINGAEWACNADHNSGSNFITEVAGHNETEKTHFWELEQNTEQIVDVQDRLKGAIEFWKTMLKVSSLVIECMEEGYKLPLLSLPPIFSAKNQKLAFVHSQFVSA